MNKFNIFVIKIILGAVFAVILMRIFYPMVHFFYVAVLGVFMVGMSYFFGYLRSKKRK